MALWNPFGKKKEETPANLPAAAPPAKETSAPAEVSAAATPPTEKGGWFSGIRSGLVKTAKLLNTDIRDLFKQEGRLVDDAFLRDLYSILIKTDMGAGPAAAIRDKIGTDFRARIVHMSDVLDVTKRTMKELLAQPERPIEFAESGPTVIMVVGVNGSGKTTSIAKLTKMFLNDGKKVVLGAGDTFRAAAVEQLTVWAQRLGCEIVKGEQGSDPASVAFRAVGRAVEIGADVCIVDTAGRLQTQGNLMKELEKIRRVMAKHIPDAPHEVLLVLDATAGQNAISQARGFSEAVQCTGIVLSKLDGTAKGGVVVPIRQQFGIPVKYIGVGEKPDDLVLFQADSFAEGLLAEM